MIMLYLMWNQVDAKYYSYYWADGQKVFSGLTCFRENETLAGYTRGLLFILAVGIVRHETLCCRDDGSNGCVSQYWSQAVEKLDTSMQGRLYSKILHELVTKIFHTQAKIGLKSCENLRPSLMRSKERRSSARSTSTYVVQYVEGKE
jgi:hypothetical protein